MIYINGRFLTQQLTGVQRFAFEMVKGITNTLSEPVCILIPPKDIDPSFEKIDLPIKVIGSRTNSLWEQIDLPAFLNKNNKPLLINLVNTAPAFYKNQVVTIHDMTVFVNPKWFARGFALYYRLIVPLIAKNALQVITVSESSKNDIVKFLNINPLKIQVVNCGIADKFFNSEENSQNDDTVLQKFNLEKHNYLLAVSSLDPRKNFKNLIEAYKLSGISIQMVIVGSKGRTFANDDLKKLIEDRENIIFTGYLSDEELIALYKQARFFVFPSLYEGFGLPPLEAMACGCATIVSNNSSMPEVCGDASLYIEAYNIDSIKNAIARLSSDDDLRQVFIEKGNIQAKKFTWNKSVNKRKLRIDKIVN